MIRLVAYDPKHGDGFYYDEDDENYYAINGIVGSATTSSRAEMEFSSSAQGFIQCYKLFLTAMDVCNFLKDMQADYLHERENEAG